MRAGAEALETIMVLAAGFGTRMRPLTDHRPKPLLELAGRTLIDRALDTAEEAGLTRAVVNLHYLGQMIGAHLQDRTTPEITLSPEEPELLDTGGGIYQALPVLGPEPFLTMNSDAVFCGPNPLTALMQAWGPGGISATADALMLFVPLARTEGYTRAGDFFLETEGQAPRRRGMAAKAPYVYTGVQILRPGAFAQCQPGTFSLNPVWDRLLDAGRLAAIVYDGTWVDVGTPAGLELASHLVAAHRDASE